MSDYADTGTSREGDPYAEIAALKADLARAVELLREVCVQYECTDFNVTSDLYEMARAYLDLVARDPADTGTSREGDPYAEIAALRTELERKDATLKEVLVGDSNISAWGRRIIDAALQPKEPPCQS